MKRDDRALALGQALLDALNSVPLEKDSHCEWVALRAEAERRGKSTRQFREWCVKHRVEIRQENHREAWVRPADVDRAIAGMPVVERRTRGDEIDEEVGKAWGSASQRARVSPRSRGRSS